MHARLLGKCRAPPIAHNPRGIVRTLGQVNYEGTLNVIAACREHGIKRIVMSSSPSTRFDGSDICGKREDEFDFGQGREYPEKFLQAYAESKAMGEKVRLKLSVANRRDPRGLHSTFCAIRSLTSTIAVKPTGIARSE